MITSDKFTADIDCGMDDGAGDNPETSKMEEVRRFLSEYLDAENVPSGEKELSGFITQKFTELNRRYETLNRRYDGGRKYPDRVVVQEGIELTRNILSRSGDDTAMTDWLMQHEDDLKGNKEKMKRVEVFFRNQVGVFDEAVKLDADMRIDREYIAQEPEVSEALNRIRLLCVVNVEKDFDYRRITEINGLVQTVRAGHDKMLEAKREELRDLGRQCMDAIRAETGGQQGMKNISDTADGFFTRKRQQIAECTSVALLDSMAVQMLDYESDIIRKIDELAVKTAALSLQDEPEDGEADIGGAASGKPKHAAKKTYRRINRSVVFPPRKLESEEDVKAYAEEMESTLLRMLKDYDGIELK